MRWRNTADSYGLVAVLLHWVMALVVVGLFVLGLWMVDLTYYDAWYQTAPDLHKAIGVLLFLLLVVRLLWRRFSPPPPPEPNLRRWERVAAGIAHRLLYVLLTVVMASGYLISTADGRPISVFGLFQVPALITGLPEQADRAGDVHLVLAVTLVIVATIHAIGALKHHVLDRDRALLRMLGRRVPRADP